MNIENEMPRKTISINKKELELLDNLSKKEHRSASQQIVHMMEFYEKYKDKVK